MNNIIKNGFLPTSYIDVTKDFEKLIKQSNHETRLKGVIDVKRLIESFATNVNVNMHTDQFNKYHFIATFNVGGKFKVKEFVAKENQKIVVLYGDIFVTDTIELLDKKGLFFEIVKEKKQEAIIKVLNKLSKDNITLQNQKLIHGFKAEMKQNIELTNKLFKKYILSDTKSKKKFEQKIRAELRNEYPEMNSDDLDQYVNLIISQS